MSSCQPRVVLDVFSGSVFLLPAWAMVILENASSISHWGARAQSGTSRGWKGEDSANPWTQNNSVLMATALHPHGYCSSSSGFIPTSRTASVQDVNLSKELFNECAVVIKICLEVFFMVLPKISAWQGWTCLSCQCNMRILNAERLLEVAGTKLLLEEVMK